MTSSEELARIAAVAAQEDLWIISDEVYHRYLYDGAQFSSIARYPEARDRTIMIDSFSKTYAMTGWRIGYLHGPASVLEQTSALAEAVTSSNNTATQAAALAALHGPQDQLDRMLGEYAANRDIVREAVASSKGLLTLPAAEGAFYAFIDITATGLASQEFALSLLESCHVAVVPGDAFGPAGEGYIRVSYVGSRAEIAEGMRRLTHFAAEHRREAVAAG